MEEGRWFDGHFCWISDHRPVFIKGIKPRPYPSIAPKVVWGVFKTQENSLLGKHIFYFVFHKQRPSPFDLQNFSCEFFVLLTRIPSYSLVEPIRPRETASETSSGAENCSRYQKLGDPRSRSRSIAGIKVKR
jgi:hypothetical protein